MKKMFSILDLIKPKIENIFFTADFKAKMISTK